MKKQTGIWIDTSKAIIVSLDGGKEKISEIDSEVENSVYHNKEGNKGIFSGSHHSNSESKFDAREKEELDFFIKKVLDYVKKSDELYFFGPGETKTRLERIIQDGNLIAPEKLKAVETSDKMTINQIASKVKSFYNQ